MKDSELDFHYFKSFSLLLLTSFVFAIFSAVVFPTGSIHYIFSAFVLAPIFIYYYQLYSKIEIITHSAIDSIYYFGFLVTLLALASGGIGFLSLDTGKQDQIFGQIAVQFAIGLFATGTAIFGRMHLLFKKMKTEEVSMDDIVQKVSESVFQMQGATVAFQGATESLVSNSKEMFDNAQKSINESLLESQAHFNREVEKSTQALVDSMNNFGQAFNNASSNDIGAVITKLAKQVAVATKSFEKMNLSSEQSTVHIDQMSGIIASFGTNFMAFSESLDKLKTSSDQLNGLDNIYDKFYTALDGSAVKVDQAGSVISESLDQISKMSEFIMHAGPSLNNARTVISNFNKHINEFSELVSKLNDNFGSIENRFSSTNDAISNLESGLSEFTGVTNQLVLSASNSSAAISEISNNTIQSSENAYRVSKALADSMQNIILTINSANETK